MGRRLGEALRFEGRELPGREAGVFQREEMKFQEVLEERGACVVSGKGSVTSSGRGTAGPASPSPEFRPEAPGPLSELTAERGTTVKRSDSCCPAPLPHRSPPTPKLLCSSELGSMGSNSGSLLLSLLDFSS